MLDLQGRYSAHRPSVRLRPTLAGEQARSTTGIEAMTTDSERIDFLEQWVQHSKGRGFYWDSFTFSTERPVREQLDEQMKAGMVELPKGSAAYQRVISDGERIHQGHQPCEAASGYSRSG